MARQPILPELEADTVLAPLATIHRAPDGYIAFARKGAGGVWENLFSLKLDELQAMFPAIAHWLVKDAYFSVNAMYRAAWGESKLTGQPAPLRSVKYLRYLNTCYVDLDVGRHLGTQQQRLTWRDASAAIGNMMDEGKIPQCSLFARSGQGVYVLWLLHDEVEDSKPPRYWPETHALYTKIQRALNHRLKCLAADANAIDAARVLRVPGTIHGKSGNPAIYQVQMDADGRPYSYTLRELAEFFNVSDVRLSLPLHVRHMAGQMVYGDDWMEEDEAARSFPAEPVELPADTLAVDTLAAVASAASGRPIKNRGSAPDRSRGTQALFAYRAQDLTVLEVWHGGWKKGTRLKRLTLYAEFLRRAGSDRETVTASIREMAGNCQPPYPSDSNDKSLQLIVEDAFKAAPKIYRNETLCAMLGITDEIARNAPLISILPPAVAQERALPPGGKRAAHRHALHALIKAYVESHGPQSCRVMLDICKANGCETNRQTVNNILNEIGCRVAHPNRRAGRRSTVQSVLALEAESGSNE